MSAIANMSFEEFAISVKASGTANKLPSLGVGEDVHSYSVYMNGPLVEQIPEKVREFQTKDVLLNALTDKLGLNSKSFRDNLKVVEIVATRNAYMESILELTKNPDVSISDRVMDDYALLTDGLSHPFISRELDAQRELSAGLIPALDKASKIVGKTVTDKAPKEISTGIVVSQSNDFTFQELLGGAIVTHENRRLEAVPEIGANVTIAYYRGQGQVFESHEKFKISKPFLDKKSNELAVALIDEKGEVQKVVLFNAATSYAKFAAAHDLDDSLIESAMDIWASSRKKVSLPELVKRTPVSEPYIDNSSGCLAVDYRENNAVFSVLFTNASALQLNAKQYGLNANQIAFGRSLELKQQVITPQIVDQSITDLVGQLKKLGAKSILDTPIDGQSFSGEVIAESRLHLAQKLGLGKVQIYDKRELDKLPGKGDDFSVKFEKGLGKVSDLIREQDRSIVR